MKHLIKKLEQKIMSGGCCDWGDGGLLDVHEH
jgi:hypothetical protein